MVGTLLVFEFELIQLPFLHVRVFGGGIVLFHTVAAKCELNEDGGGENEMSYGEWLSDVLLNFISCCRKL